MSPPGVKLGKIEKGRISVDVNSDSQVFGETFPFSEAKEKRRKNKQKQEKPRRNEQNTSQTKERVKKQTITLLPENPTVPKVTSGKKNGKEERNGNGKA